MEHESHNPEPNELPLETILSLLRNRRRRRAVDILSERESPVALFDLAEAVASAEPPAESAEPSTNSTRDVVAALHHVHLPKLDAAGVVDYDPEATVVVPVRTTALEPFTDPIAEKQ